MPQRLDVESIHGVVVVVGVDAVGNDTGNAGGTGVVCTGATMGTGTLIGVATGVIGILTGTVPVVGVGAMFGLCMGKVIVMGAALVPQ
jgi:hypothetical protein